MNKKIKSLVLSLALLVSSAAPVFAADVTRIAGSNRYETALKVNQKYFSKANGNVAVMVSGNDFKSALYGSQLASALNVPFFVNEKHGIKNTVLKKISDLGVNKVYVIGDYKYLDKSIDNTLLSKNFKVIRVQNTSKEGIPYDIDMTIFNTFWNDGIKGDIGYVMLINDNKFPDLLSVIPLSSALARKEKIALFPLNENEYTKQFDYMDGYGFIIGGYNSVPAKFITGQDYDHPIGLISHKWQDEDGTINEYYTGRIAGRDRYETAVEIAKAYKPLLNKTINTIVIVNGENYPDALASGVVATNTNGAILLTQPNVLNQDTKKYIEDNNIKNIVIVGGENSVSKNVENELRALN